MHATSLSLRQAGRKSGKARLLMLGVTLAGMAASSLAVASGSQPVRTALAKPALATNLAYWVESSYANVFQDAQRPANADTTVSWLAARHEYSSAQIVLRSTQAQTIQSVSFSDLVSGSNRIAAANLKANFVEYVALSANSKNYPTSQLVRQGAGLYPDPLSSQPATSVAANTSQAVWLTVYTPKNAAVGVYRGTVNIVTAGGGTLTVPISLEVANVTLPDANSVDAFDFTQWSQASGYMMQGTHFADHNVFTDLYGVSKYVDKWWQLAGQLGDVMQAHRINRLRVYPLFLLLDGGSTLGADGRYRFDWQLFDRFVQFYIDRGNFKRFMGASSLIKAKNTLQFLANDSNGQLVIVERPYDSPEARNWLDQFVPALVAHLREKGWLASWWQGIGDEPDAAIFQSYSDMVQRFRAQAPGLQIGDAYNNVEVMQYFATAGADTLVPMEWILESYRNQFDPPPSGKKLYFYTVGSQNGSYLNRQIDTPAWQGRSLFWLAYRRGATGYLHWALNNWLNPKTWQYLSPDGWGYKGETLVTYPDVSGFAIKSSIRLANLREGVEDYELLKILGAKNPALAQQYVGRIVSSGTQFSRDIKLMKTVRDAVLRAAAQ